MPNNNIIPVTAGTLPQGFCPSDYQSILNGFVSVMSVTIPNTASSLQVSQTKPSDTTKPWLQLDSLGRPVRIYYFAQGAWISLHPDFSGKTIIYTGVLPDFTIFDGGDSKAIGPYSGPMWQIANTQLNGTGTDVFNGRVPIGLAASGAGTFPSGATITLLQQLGEDLHKLTGPECFPHTHAEKIAVNRAVTNGGSIDTSGNGGFVGPIGSGGTEIVSQSAFGDPSTASGGNPPTDSLGHNTLPPCTGVFFLQRTSRLYYTVN